MTAKEDVVRDAAQDIIPLVQRLLRPKSVFQVILRILGSKDVVETKGKWTAHPSCSFQANAIAVEPSPPEDPT